MLGMPEVCKALYDADADINAVNLQHKKAQEIARASKEEVVKVLESVSIEPNRDEGANWNEIHFDNGLPIKTYPDFQDLDLPSRKDKKNFEILMQTPIVNPDCQGRKVELTLTEKESRLKPILDRFTGCSLLDHILIHNLYTQHLFDEIYDSRHAINRKMF